MYRIEITLPTLFALLILVAQQDIGPFEARPAITREEIQAARDKFDREMKLDTKRPWDGLALTGPHALEKGSEPPGK